MLFGVILSAAMFSPSTVLARPEGVVVYGGFAFAGNAGDIASSYPYSLLVDRKGGSGASLFETRLSSFFHANAHSIPGITISFDTVRKGEPSCVLALALTNEKVLKETLGDIHKLVVQLDFELLTLDFEGMQIVSSAPICLELVDDQKSEFSESDIADRIFGMIDGDQSQLIVALVSKIGRIRAESRNVCTLQVISVMIGDKALPFMPASLRGRTDTYGQTVAQLFGSLLSAQAGVALLPHVKDGLNSKMSLRFADATALQFKIPSPTFAVSLDLKGFKKVLKERTDAETLWIYGAFLGVKVYEPEFKTVYLDTTAKFGVPKIVPASQAAYDEFPVVSDALKGAVLNAIEAMQRDPTTKTKVLNRCQL